MAKTGDISPDFQYTDWNGNTKNFHELNGIKIIYFFPKAFTPGCTKQSCSIRDSYKELKENGISEIFGISTDSRETLSQFADEYDLDFLLVNDERGVISKAYGVFKNRIVIKYVNRDTFIIDGDNRIVSILNNGITGRKSKLGLKNHGDEIMLQLKNLNLLPLDGK